MLSAGGLQGRVGGDRGSPSWLPRLLSWSDVLVGVYVVAFPQTGPFPLWDAAPQARRLLDAPWGSLGARSAHALGTAVRGPVLTAAREAASVAASCKRGHQGLGRSWHLLGVTSREWEAVLSQVSVPSSGAIGSVHRCVRGGRATRAQEARRGVSRAVLTSLLGSSNQAGGKGL